MDYGVSKDSADFTWSRAQNIAASRAPCSLMFLCVLGISRTAYGSTNQSDVNALLALQNKWTGSSTQFGRNLCRVCFPLEHRQDVAIKKMKATKSKEFVAELKVLCKVHHSNLIELIGYAVGEEELYLVYDFAAHGALSDRLHNPVKKGYQPLSWAERVQIALDAARGLEYIHDHTRTHYIHRDVKTSNILLDGLFRAKVGDFGLAKLLEHAGGEGEDVTTKVVGTVGYLAPEYIRDGQVTYKSDVYAFGVVLMELITGLEALSKSRITVEGKVPDQRSLVSLLYALSYGGEINFEKLRAYVDSNLEDNYPEEGILKMAKLARVCVDEDSMFRPDMREVVFKLSQLLLASIEWEASLAGSSQIFSGIVGR